MMMSCFNEDEEIFISKIDVIPDHLHYTALLNKRVYTYG